SAAPRAGLYAVEKAVTLYERLGFAAQGEAWAHRADAARPARASATQPFRKDDLLHAQRLDRDATGMDRTYLLRGLFRAHADTMRVGRRDGRLVGYGIAKPSPGVTELGPIVAVDPETADALIDALLACTNGPHEAT